MRTRTRYSVMRPLVITAIACFAGWLVEASGAEVLLIALLLLIISRGQP